MIGARLNVMVLNFLIGSYEWGWIKPFSDPHTAIFAGGVFLGMAVINALFLIVTVFVAVAVKREARRRA